MRTQDPAHRSDVPRQTSDRTPLPTRLVPVDPLPAPEPASCSRPHSIPASANPSLIPLPTAQPISSEQENPPHSLVLESLVGRKKKRRASCDEEQFKTCQRASHRAGTPFGEGFGRYTPESCLGGCCFLDPSY
ncbi:unnamed protein product [Boreogadus saida]